MNTAMHVKALEDRRTFGMNTSLDIDIATGAHLTEQAARKVGEKWARADE
jgi:hypothetical protein